MKLHPITRRRWQRFRSLGRAWWSFWLLIGAYGISLGSEWLCNEKPLWVRFEGCHYFPLLRYTSERAMMGEGHATRMDFKRLEKSERFQADPDNRMLWPLIPYGPREIVQPESIALPDEVTVRILPEPRLAIVQVDAAGRVSRGVAAGYFFGGKDGEEEGHLLEEIAPLPPALREALAARFRNETAPALAVVVEPAGGDAAELSLLPYAPRAAPPRTVRVTLRAAADERRAAARMVLDRDGQPQGRVPDFWAAWPDEAKDAVREMARQRFEGRVEPRVVEVAGARHRVHAEREEVRYPFRPVAGHPLGLDSAGRDVLARMLYGLRTSMTFGLLLTMVTLLLGTLFGAMQGYHGGPVDIVGQRVIEIWDSLPFLYILMLMGSVYGRSFGLLLVCYGLFNWVGISYYMRAEFLRLRRQPFVEAARALGLPDWKIMFRHILPNALVPLITFFPFSLVSAIGTLAALDFLGFGLPPPTPSWGEMLAQAQEYAWAWWITVYPSLALFAVMLMGVFVGEGMREAFDPKPYSRME